MVTLAYLWAPMIIWSLDDLRSRSVHPVLLIGGYLLVIAMWWAGAVALHPLACILWALVARVGLPTGDALVLGYVALLLGFFGGGLVVVTVYLLMELPMLRRPGAPAIPLITVVSAVVGLVGTLTHALP